MDKIHNEIIKMSHSYFSEKDVTPEEIRKYIDRMKSAYPEVTLDEALLFRKLETIHSVIVGAPDVLDDVTDHEEWFNPSTNSPITEDFDWHFWEHFRNFLSTKKGWPNNVVDSIDRLSSEILSRIEDPRRDGKWDRRGMVMGSVQSGKTANYTALITKAADAGYKLFIVLAGVHNSLRSQTQSRLNDEFLGYDLDKVQKLTGMEKRIGVRTLYPDHGTVYTLTSSNERGDFNKVIASQSGIFPSTDGPPIILVIKKNVSILRNLINWVPSIIGATDYTGRRYIPDIPVLVIDDESDYASINTKQPELDENGNVNSEWDPTTTNRLIRSLLTIFDKSTYVGYTATPYANIFIHKDLAHEIYGEDLFPRSFIISLPTPSNYLGPEKVFGLGEDPERDVEKIEPLPLIRIVDDHSDSIPDKHRKNLIVGELPESMIDAIKSFLLSCAARSLREEGPPHNSMLIHVTRFTAVQALVFELVERELRKLTARIMSGENLDDFREIWESDYLPTTRKMTEKFQDAVEHSWEDIAEQLYKTTRLVKVKVINGTARDYLDYREVELYVNSRIRAGEDIPGEERGLNVIVIGGDKLSRGLTLEGLTVSYYLRATKMYDTLMQMGRWFGYRDGYSDLCRIFTTGELIEWYRHIAGATLELREEINYMAAIGETPENFGLKVRSHPGRLVVTSAGKSRHAARIDLSYSGRISETIVFDRKHSKNNRKALAELIEEIGRPCDEDMNPNSPRYRWHNVESDTVINFLDRYRIQDVATRTVKPAVLSGYIERQVKNGELLIWDVVIVSKLNAEQVVDIGGYSIGCVIRKINTPMNGSFSIGRLVSPSDELLDLTDEEIEQARQFDRQMGKDVGDTDKPSGPAIRAKRPPERGLLLIYLPHGKDDRTGREYGGPGEEVVGFAISFPMSDTAVPIQYVVNPVYVQEEEQCIL
nr:endonuclease [Desulfobacterales bacterium]